jgi:HEAT repeat protein
VRRYAMLALCAQADTVEDAHRNKVAAALLPWLDNFGDRERIREALIILKDTRGALSMLCSRFFCNWRPAVHDLQELEWIPQNTDQKARAAIATGDWDTARDVSEEAAKLLLAQETRYLSVEEKDLIENGIIALGSAAVPRLKEILENFQSTDQQQQEAARRLGRIGQPAAEALVDLLDRGISTANVVEALGELRDRRALKRLIELACLGVSSRTRSAAWAAANAIDPQWPKSREAAEILPSLREGMHQLRPLVEDSDYPIYQAARSVIREITGTEE